MRIRPTIWCRRMALGSASPLISSRACETLIFSAASVMLRDAGGGVGRRHDYKVEDEQSRRWSCCYSQLVAGGDESER